jgi:hypothetical protein
MKRTAPAVFALFSLALLASAFGCGGKKSDEGSGKTSTTAASGASAGHTSCSVISAVGTCNEYAREDSLGLSKGLCEGFKGTYAQTPCPADNVTGTCALPNDEWKKYYVTKDFAASFSVDEAKKDCESDLLKGTFTAAANPPKKPEPAASASASAGTSSTTAPIGKSPTSTTPAPKKK